MSNNRISINSKEDIIDRYGDFLLNQCRDELFASLIDTSDHPLLEKGRPDIIIWNKHIRFNALVIYILPPEEQNPELSLDQKKYACGLIFSCNHKVIATSSYEELIMKTVQYMTGLYFPNKDNPNELQQPLNNYVEYDREEYNEFVDDVYRAKYASTS
jgi:hypothetical protein